MFHSSGTIQSKTLVPLGMSVRSIGICSSIRSKVARTPLPVRLLHSGNRLSRERVCFPSGHCIVTGAHHERPHSERSPVQVLWGSPRASSQTAAATSSALRLVRSSCAANEALAIGEVESSHFLLHSGLCDPRIESAHRTPVVAEVGCGGANKMLSTGLRGGVGAPIGLGIVGRTRRDVDRLGRLSTASPLASPARRTL